MDYVSHPLVVEKHKMTQFPQCPYDLSTASICHFLAHSNKIPHMSVITQEHVNGKLCEGPVQIDLLEGANPSYIPVRLGTALLGLSPDWLITNTVLTIVFCRGNMRHINGYFVKTFFWFFFPSPQLRRMARLCLI